MVKNLIKIPIPVWIGLVTISVVVGGAFLLSSVQLGGSGQWQRGKTTIGEDVPIQGQDHIQPGQSHPAYNSNPPTSGWHWPNAAKNGIYDSQLPDEQLIHNLEHGHIWISYKPDIADEAKNQLKALVKKDDWKIVLAPRPQNDSAIALAAWGRILKLSDFDEAKIKEFIKAYRNQGPEKTPD